MIQDLVSTIIPVYNRPMMLREAVASVLAQTWRPIEVIIVDDGSTDETVSVADGFAQSHPEIIRVLRQDNAGPGVARQHGLEFASGEFVQFLDSDDLLLPEKFALQIAGLRVDTEAQISYGKAYASELGVRGPSPAQRTGEVFRSLFPALLAEPLWPTMTPLYRRNFLDRVGPWPRARQLEDWVYDAQAGACGAKLQYVDAFIAETRNHGEQRLCQLWRGDDEALRERVAAHISVFAHARSADVPLSAPEFLRYARTLFWAAREAGRRGLATEASELLDLARTIPQARSWDIRLFAMGAKLLGWERVSRLAGRVGR